MPLRISRYVYCTITIVVSSFAAHTPGAITVLTYNDARLPIRDVHEAQREATNIFKRAHIETVWVDCPTTTGQAGMYPLCPIAITPTSLVVHIVSEAMAQAYLLEPGALGVALGPSDGSFGLVAILCGGRITTLAHQVGAHAIGPIMGILMAHEVGHLLLGSGAHSQFGIMHTPWSATELTSLTATAEEFSRTQADRMRIQAAERVDAEAAHRTMAKLKRPTRFGDPTPAIPDVGNCRASGRKDDR